MVEQTIKQLVKDAVCNIVGICPQDITLTQSKEDQFGDYSSPIALQLSKDLKQSPQELGQKIADYLNKGPKDLVEKVEVAGPGFINFYLSKAYLLNQVQNILSAKRTFGRSDLNQSKTYLVEFGQPNTHKVFHIGHLKSAITGQALANILEAVGYNVKRVNYFGDIGMHVAKCIWGMQSIGMPPQINKYASDQKAEFIQKAYQLGASKFLEDKKTETVIRAINRHLYLKDDKKLNTLYQQSRGWSLEHHQDVYSQLGVHYDRQYPESEIYATGLKIVRQNIGNIFKKDQGAVIFEGEKIGLHNRVFITSEQNPTYEAKDLALAELKYTEFQFDESIIFTGVEQVDYFKVIIAAFELLHPKLKNHYQHKGFGHLLTRGKKASSREGVEITGKGLIKLMTDLAYQKIQTRDFPKRKKQTMSQTIGLGALRYMILKHPIHMNINFDPDQALSIDGDAAPYIIYAYIRAKSILKEAKPKSHKSILNLLNDYQFTSGESLCLKKLHQYPQAVQNAAEKLTPHLLVNYLYDLAQTFMLFYRDNPVLKVQNKQAKEVRLLITAATAQVIKNGLALLQIDTVEQM